MKLTEQIKEKVLKGEQISKSEALVLYETPLEELCEAADEIRAHFCGNAFDICTIINGKSGRCSENCKYCAQSAYYHTGAEEYPLLGKEEIVRQAQYNAERGVLRYSIVTSGRALKDLEVDEMTTLHYDYLHSNSIYPPGIPGKFPWECLLSYSN